MYRINKYAANLPEFGIWANGFSEDEVDKIVFLEKVLKFNKGTVGSITNVDEKARDSKVAFLPIDAKTDWIWQRFAGIVPKVNYDLFLKDVECIQSLQYTIYTHRDKQFYDWHVDAFPHYEDMSRKISGVMLLSDPEEYEGGEFEIVNTPNPEHTSKFKPKKGDIVFFSSTMPHKVHPVTKGTRRSLVLWVLGKRES